MAYGKKSGGGMAASGRSGGWGKGGMDMLKDNTRIMDGGGLGMGPSDSSLNWGKGRPDVCREGVRSKTAATPKTLGPRTA